MSGLSDTDAVVVVTSFDGRSAEYFNACMRNPDTMVDPCQDYQIVSLYFSSEMSVPAISRITNLPKRDVWLRLRMFLGKKELAREISLEDQFRIVKALKNRREEYLLHVRNSVLPSL